LFGQLAKTQFLSDYLTERRKLLIEQVLSKRTDHLAIVLEDVYHAQNMSAVMRSAECFGIQNIHVIEHLHQYEVNPRIVRGATKWLDIHHYSSTDQTDPSVQCIKDLKQKGYQILATSPDAEATPIQEMDFSIKSAVVFGTEFTGISETASKMADDHFCIPMMGFTESLNISVCAALVMQEAINQFHRSEVDWRLSEDRQNEIRYSWYFKCVKRAEMLLGKFTDIK
jgi:tRNA (guanosine-2'-O-)-methyltransferase